MRNIWNKLFFIAVLALGVFSGSAALAARSGACVYSCQTQLLDGQRQKIEPNKCDVKQDCLADCNADCNALNNDTCKDYTCTAGGQTVGDGCSAKGDPTQVKDVENLTKTASADWSCQVTTFNDTLCVKSSACTGGSFCCVPNIGTPPGKTSTGAPQTTTTRTVVSGGILLPACFADGNCTLDDIVSTGAAFANFLFGISGAIALAILVYGGILYLTAAGGTEQVKKAKHMIVQATIGLVIVFGANAIIRFVVTSLTRQTEAISACEQTKGAAGFSCQVVPGDTQKEIDANAKDRGCVKQLCNLPGQGNNVLCCPAEPPK